MKALLIIAHGSRRAQSNQEIVVLGQKIAAEAGGQFERVECAFLELADPLIPAGIDSLVAAGATEIKVLPYFLARGTHVAVDVPEEVEKAAASHPSVAIDMLPYFGSSPELPSMLLQLAVAGTAS